MERRVRFMNDKDASEATPLFMLVETSVSLSSFIGNFGSLFEQVCFYSHRQISIAVVAVGERETRRTNAGLAGTFTCVTDV